MSSMSTKCSVEMKGPDRNFTFEHKMSKVLSGASIMLWSMQVLLRVGLIFPRKHMDNIEINQMQIKSHFIYILFLSELILSVIDNIL